MKKKLDEMNLIDTFSILLIKDIMNELNNKEIYFPYEVDDIYNKLNEYYYLINGEKLDISYEIQKIKLYNWGKKVTRYQILNNLIIEQVRKFVDLQMIGEYEIDNRDLFMVTNLKSLLTEVYDSLKNMIIDNDDSVCEFSKITKDKVIFLVRNILMEIDPSLEWLKIYNDAIDNNKIIYLNELSDDEKKQLKLECGIDKLDNMDDMCVILPDNNLCLLLNYDGTIADVPRTIHEIIHYIIKTMHGADNEVHCLKEFPSIFYELYALRYLSRRGFDGLEIASINNIRLTDTFECIMSTATLRRYISMFCDDMEITEMVDRNIYADKLNELFESVDKSTINELMESVPEIFDLDTAIYEMCDGVIKDLIINPWYLFNTYPYVIGNYLAIHAINEYEYDESMLEKVKEYVSNITTIDPFKVFYDVGVDVIGLNITETDYDLVKKYKKLVKKRGNLE